MFTLEDWLELPDAETEGRMGTYVFVVVEDETIEGIRGIEYKNSGSNQDTQRTGNMVKQYGVTSARKTSARKNSVYLCSGGVRYSYERGYLNLLEGCSLSCWRLWRSWCSPTDMLDPSLGPLLRRSKGGLVFLGEETLRG